MGNGSSGAGNRSPLKPHSFWLPLLVSILGGYHSGGFAFPIAVSESPASALQTTVSAIRSAKKTIFVNIYEFTSDQVAEALIERIQAGVHVEVIEEGEPVGGFSSKSEDIRSQIVTAMQEAGDKANDHFSVMAKGPDETRRFKFDHAKYLVVDNSFLFVGSENFSTMGTPAPGISGSRGWQVYLQEDTIAHEFAKMFQADRKPDFGDITELVKEDLRQWLPRVSSADHWINGLPETRVRSATRELEVDVALNFEADAVEKITSPDSSRKGLLKLINSAKRTLDIEQMTFSSLWGATGKPSPLFEAVVRAGRRGVNVRVLVNDERAFSQHGDTGADGWDHSRSPRRAKKNKNKITVDALNKVARDEDLNLHARIANVKAMGVHHIHNKGLLVDGEKTLISSINWNQNSVENNREAAVVIEGSQVNGHFQALFNKDWKASQKH